MQLADFCNSFLVFNNGRDALDNLKAIIRANKKLPDVILLDLNMPVMDGWQFLDEFLREPTPKPILIYIVTSSIDPDDVNRAKIYDAVTNYIVKPITLETLKNILNDVKA
jgi:CheY-like chemotaxis protein